MKLQNLIKPIVAALALSVAFTVTAARADSAIPKTYPLKKCVVSDEKLGEHGKAHVFTHDGQEIKLCCKDCLKDFKKDPKKFVKKLAEEQKKPADKK